MNFDICELSKFCLYSFLIYFLTKNYSQTFIQKNKIMIRNHNIFYNFGKNNKKKNIYINIIKQICYFLI